jgi:dihydroorotase
MPQFLPKIKVIDPKSPHHGQTVNMRINEGEIVEIGQNVAKKDGDEHIERSNAHIAPSWVDIGTQSGEPGFEHRETLTSLASAAHAGGYGHLVIRPNTEPPLDQAAAIRNIKNHKTREGVDFHPMALASLDAKGEELTEWLDLAQAGAAAFTDGPHALNSNAFMLKAMQYSQHCGKPLIHSPHDATFIPKAMVHESRQSVEMGLRAWPAASETLLIDRDINLLQYVSGRLVWHNISSRAAIEKLKNAKNELNLAVNAGVGYLYLCFTEEEVAEFNTLFKLSPPLRSDRDRQALWAAVEEELIHYVSSDHFPLEEDRKKTSFPNAEFGAEGLETAMSGFISYCPLKNPLDHWVRMAAHGPRSLLKWDPVVIQKGQRADFTIFDPSIVRVFEVQELKSKSKNNPHLGRNLAGKVLGRISGDNWIPISEK